MLRAARRAACRLRRGGAGGRPPADPGHRRRGDRRDLSSRLRHRGRTPSGLPVHHAERDCRPRRGHFRHHHARPQHRGLVGPVLLAQASEIAGIRAVAAPVFGTVTGLALGMGIWLAPRLAGAGYGTSR
ncbi:MAG: hypothetical protein ACE5KF_08865 [Kiloniellaceae bacterium]